MQFNHEDDVTDLLILYEVTGFMARSAHDKDFWRNYEAEVGQELAATSSEEAPSLLIGSRLVDDDEPH